jgi:hypothetical protein
MKVSAIDLDLLVAFAALFAERTVTLAARRLAPFFAPRTSVADSGVAAGGADPPRRLIWHSRVEATLHIAGSVR